MKVARENERWSRYRLHGPVDRSIAQRREKLGWSGVEDDASLDSRLGKNYSPPKLVPKSRRIMILTVPFLRHGLLQRSYFVSGAWLSSYGLIIRGNIFPD